MDNHETSTVQTHGRTEQNGRKYAQHHIQEQKDQHLEQGEDKSHRYNNINNNNNNKTLFSGHNP